jgi:CDP-paratose 2-epimerase
MGKVLVTGGAGFIGSNAVSRYLKQGHHVVLIDNLSRKGTRFNLRWLCPQGKLEFIDGDVRDAEEMDRIFDHHGDADLVLHLAGQVAVTCSVNDAREDFEINALGSFNVLESVRKAGMDCPVLYSSTNKVYGGLEDVNVVEEGARYCLEDRPMGVSEQQPLDFHSPYGCSKGAADQYFRDYHRIYGLRTVVLRQSCIYGYRQFGIEDQGWVAWFIIAAELGKPITIYGDGKQVRDVLFIDDLIDAYDAAAAHIDVTEGNVYNIGGGPGNAMSLRELLGYLAPKYKALETCYADWRQGDQRVFISDIQRAHSEFGWTPRVSTADGIARLQGWVAQNRELFQ